MTNVKKTKSKTNVQIQTSHIKQKLTNKIKQQFNVMMFGRDRQSHEKQIKINYEASFKVS